MNAPDVAGLASVIVPCWNQLEFTRKCINASFRKTTPSWELIVVDNGSTDGTGDYLAGVQDVSPLPVTLIANGTNRGFPAAVNQGLGRARGEYLVLLNNDVVVTDGWLEQLVALAELAEWTSETSNPKPETEIQPYADSHPYPGRDITLVDLAPVTEKGRIGLVGPMSNYAAPPQLIDDVPYRDLDEMKVFACVGGRSTAGSGLRCRSFPASAF